MNKRRLVSMILVGTMLTTLVVGCSDPTSATGSTEASKGTTTSTSEPAKKSEAATPIKITLPGDRPADTDKLIAAIEEKCDLNVKLNFVFYPNADIEQKTRLSLASGEPNDLIWSAGRADMISYIQAGYLEKLDDLIPKYAPDIVKNRPQAMWDNSKYKDELYSIPMGVYNRIGRHWNIRADLRKELGFDEITTMEELLKFAYAVKENYPEIPPIVTGSYGGEQYTSWGTFQFTGLQTSEFIDRTFISPSGLMFYLKNNDGKVYNLFDSKEPLIMEKIAEARKLYQDGILYSDLLSLKTYRDTMAENKAAIIPWPEIIPEAPYRNRLASNVPGGEIESVVWYEELTSQKGTMLADYKAWNHQSLAKVSKNKEKVLEFLNWTQSKENYDLCAYGIEGEHCRLVGDDKFENTTSKLRQFGYAWIWSPYLDRIDVNATEKEFRIDSWMRKGDPTDFVANVAGPLIFDPSNVKSELAQYMALEAKYYAPIFNGVVDTEEYLSKFKAEAYDLSKILQAEYQSQLDAALKK